MASSHAVGDLLFNGGACKARSFRHLILAAYSAPGLQQCTECNYMLEQIRDSYQYFTESKGEMAAPRGL